VCGPTVAIAERLVRPARPALYVEECVRGRGPPVEWDLERLYVAGQPHANPAGLA